MVGEKALLRPFDVSSEDVERLSPSEYPELLKCVHKICRKEIKDISEKSP